MTTIDELCLDAEQEIAVLLPAEGRSAIVASAGAGKTAVLTSRAAYLRKTASNKKGTVVALTYTKKAAEEFGQRLKLILQSERGRRSFQEAEQQSSGISRRIWTGTIHAFARKIIEDITERRVWRSLPRQEREQLDSMTDMFEYFVEQDGHVMNILSERESVELWNQVIMSDRRLGASFMNNWKRGKDDICGLWCGRQATLMVGQIIRPAIPHPGTDKAARTRHWEPFDITELEEYAATLYQAAKTTRSKVNYDDLLWMASAALRFIPHLKEHYRENLTHVLIDEAQDIGFLDYMFLMTLPGFLPIDSINATLGYTLTGDARQEIYGFKAGQSGLFRILLENGWASQEARLNTNYRSGPEIVRLASRVAQNPYLGMNFEPTEEHRCHAAETAAPAKVTWTSIPSNQPFSDYLLPIIRDSLNEQHHSRAILLRTNRMCRATEELLDTIKGAREAFVVSTVHSAKGLEWDHVILSGLDRNGFPTKSSFWETSAETLHNESKLLYVGITRARRRLDVLETDRGVFYSAVMAVP